MITLPRPVTTVKEAFSSCLSIVKNKELKCKLEAVTQAIVQAEAEYTSAGESQSLHLICPCTKIGNIVSKRQMVAVYGRLVKKDTPGRQIYDELKLAPPNGQCPLCGKGDVYELDHFLPKSDYPVFAVTPLNLIPSCRDCNGVKSRYHSAEPGDVPLHPYFDSLDDVEWLQAAVVETSPASVRFYVEGPADWDPVTRKRTLKHFELFDLASRYSRAAAVELTDVRHRLKDLFKCGGLDEVRGDLVRGAESYGSSRRNGWRAATYRALAESDWFCDGGFAKEG